MSLSSQEHTMVYPVAQPMDGPVSSFVIFVLPPGLIAAFGWIVYFQAPYVTDTPQTVPDMATIGFVCGIVGTLTALAFGIVLLLAMRSNKRRQNHTEK